MKKVIGIVGEGPTDYLVIKEVIDFVSGEENAYIRLQPEPNLQGKFGNGWKGVWKWCEDTAPILEKIFCIFLTKPLDNISFMLYIVDTKKKGMIPMK